MRLRLAFLTFVVSAAAHAGTFSATGSLAAAREDHTATLLSNGKILIAGGTGAPTSAEIYDPVTRQFAVTGSMAYGRSAHTATLLLSGKVLMAGGGATTAELYDPATGSFSATGSLPVGFKYHTATLLPNGKVLIAGGVESFAARNAAYLYDTATGTFTATDAMDTARYDHTATLLSTGKVLIAGGTGLNGAGTVEVEVYDPSVATFSAGIDLLVGRTQHTATGLPNGKVLIAGGHLGVYSAEVYDPASGSTNAGFSPRLNHTATLLTDGKVLIVGGRDVMSQHVTWSEIFNPATNSFSTGTYVVTPRDLHTATLLTDGDVLIAGGRAGTAPSAAAEIYDASAGTFSATGTMAESRETHSSTVLQNGKVLVTRTFTPEVDIYDPSTGLFAVHPYAMQNAHYWHSAVLMSSGSVVVAGGENGLTGDSLNPATGQWTETGPMSVERSVPRGTLLPNGKLLISGGRYYDDSLGWLTHSSAEVLDPSTGNFLPTGGMAANRVFHSATLLKDGKVLIAGGVSYAPFAYHASAELYDPITGTFTATGNMGAARSSHTATLLADGNVLIAGGNTYGGSVHLSAEVYNPTTGTFSPTGSMAGARYQHTATLLTSGKVLLAGGYTDAGATLASAELYNPTTGTFSAAGTMSSQRTYHSSVLLPNGKVLISGGRVSDSVRLATAELYDPGYADSRRPVITDVATSLVQPASLTVSGSGFRADADGSSGATNSSPANYPVLRLQRVDNDRTFIVSSTSWSDTSLTSTVLSGLPTGHYRLAIVRNGVPSLQRLVSIEYPPPTITSLYPYRGPAGGGQEVTVGGTHLTGAQVHVDGVAAVVTASSATTLTFITPPHAYETVPVVVSTPGGSASTNYIYAPPMAPPTISAEAETSSSVGIWWSQVESTVRYELERSSNGLNFEPLAQPTDHSYVDTGLSPTTSYLYRVRAVDTDDVAGPYSESDLATTVIFTDPMLIEGAVPIKAVHLTELRSAVDAVRALAGSAPGMYTDANIVAGVTPVKAVHFNELITALYEAFATLQVGEGRTSPASVGGIIYTIQVAGLRWDLK